MSSITDKMPSFAVLGLATISILSQSPSGQIAIRSEVPEAWMGNRDVSKGYLSERFNLSNINQIMSFGSDVETLINSVSGFGDFLNETIVKLQSSFDVFGYTLEAYVDLSEGSECLRLNIFSMDDDKIEKYSNFIDSWVESVPSKFLDKLVFAV